MALFPTFINLDSKNLLLIGGGNVASRKLEKLLMFSPKNLKIIAKKTNDEFKEICLEHKLSYQERAFEMSDLEAIDLVIVAVDDIPLQKEIFEYCEQRNILCNSVDSTDYCNFIFPALVTRGDLCIGINTNGKAPYLSKILRRKLDKLLPDALAKVVEESHQFRSSFKDKKAMEQTIKDHVKSLVDKISF